MNISIDSDHLKNGLTKLINIVDKKNSRPALTNLFLHPFDGRLEMSATDLEVSAKVQLQVSIREEAIDFCINAKAFYDVIKELPSGQVELTLGSDENLLKVSCNSIHYSLVITQGEEFPTLSFHAQEVPFEIDATTLCESISHITHAISTDETRLFLNGIFLHEKDSVLKTIALDGHRLAVMNTNQPVTSPTLQEGVIVPKKGVFELKKMAELLAGEKLRLAVDDSFLFAQAGEDYFLSIRLMAKEYPNYQSVIPAKTTFQLETERDALLNAVRRIKIMSCEKNNGIKLKLNSTTLKLTAKHPTLGDAEEMMDASFNGEEIEISLNAKYLQDVIATLPTGRVTFEINNEFSPILIRSAELDAFIGILMPIRY